MPFLYEACGRMVYTKIDRLTMYQSQLKKLRDKQVDNIKVLNFNEEEKELLKLIDEEVAERKSAKMKSVEVARNSFVVMDNSEKNVSQDLLIVSEGSILSETHFDV